MVTQKTFFIYEVGQGWILLKHWDKLTFAFLHVASSQLSIDNFCNIIVRIMLWGLKGPKNAKVENVQTWEVLDSELSQH